nr:receptor-like protein kinase feronia [Quercus suber]
MGNTNLCTAVLPCLTFTTLYLAFLLLHLSNTLAINSPSPYKSVNNIILNCGSSDNSTALDGRTWTGDVNSKFFPQELSQNQASLATNSLKQSLSASQVPYTTARLSVSPFTYIFPITTDQKFVRLYYYPASYRNFDRSKALFSVKVGHFTLLSNFSASLTADADGDPGDTIYREFCVNIEEDEKLNLTFTPSDSSSFAFVNGIEILSIPANLYYTPSEVEGLQFIGQQKQYLIGDRTALEMIYRINVGGSYISPTEDTGMFRRWEPDVEYLRPRKSALPANMTIELIFAKIPPYTTPQTVYRTAPTMETDKAFNKNHNLTWEFPVDSEFDYAVMLHFCDFQPELVDWHDRVFLIFIANQTAGKAADVMFWSGRRKGVPVYRDYAVSMVGPNPGPLPLTPPTAVPPKNLVEAKNYRATIIAVVGGGVSGFTILLILVVLIFRLAKRVKYSENSTKASGSTLPCSLSRYFSLAEIKSATNNFDNEFIIGTGGFGDVYKGYINGEVTPVAIKRLKSGSQQGAQEFKTKIAILSRFRHLHLISLIGYCEHGN